MKRIWIIILVVILTGIIVQVLSIENRLRKAEAEIESLIDWSNEIDP